MPKSCKAHSTRKQKVWRLKEPSRLATLTDFATQDFEALGSGIAREMPALAEWLEEAKNEYILTRIALLALQDDPLKMSERANSDSVLMLEFAGELLNLQKTYEGRAMLLGSAATRIFCGLARHAVATGQA